MTSRRTQNCTAIVVGAGPAGLAAAEAMAAAGLAVTVHDWTPSPARKFLMAGRGGLNLTHSEPLDAFLDRYGSARDRLQAAIHAFPPDALRAWCHELGVETFVGTSGRVFPQAMKASPLLRAWLKRLDGLGVQLKTRSRWTGWDGDALAFETPDGRAAGSADVVVFALGGASWPRLGSDGGWGSLLQARGVDVVPMRPANCGFQVRWSSIFSDAFAGQPLKPSRLSFRDWSARGEAMITKHGIEGGGVYALSSHLRDALQAGDDVHLEIDLAPDLDEATLSKKLSGAGVSTANRLRRAGLSRLAASLLRESAEGAALPPDARELARRIKAVRLRLVAPMPLDRAISTAGGVGWASVNEDFSLKPLPSTFVCGEMLDWEAPTGGYLLQACIATGRAAGAAAARRALSGA